MIGKFPWEMSDGRDWTGLSSSSVYVVYFLVLFKIWQKMWLLPFPRKKSASSATPWTPLPLCCLRTSKTSFAVSTTAACKNGCEQSFLCNEILLGQAEISRMYWTCLSQIQPLLLIYFKGKFLTSSYNRNSLTQEQCEQIEIILVSFFLSSSQQSLPS